MTGTPAAGLGTGHPWPGCGSPSCGQPGHRCAACVPPLSTPTERLAALRSALATETEPVVAVTHLLRLCRDEHAVLWERVSDRACQDIVRQALRPLADLFRSRSPEPALDDEVRHHLAAAMESIPGMPPVVMAHALAQFLDDRYASTFPEFFRRRSPYRPQVGDPVPLDYPALRAVTQMPFTSPPWRLANRLDETRHLRLAGEWAVQFQVVFDYVLDGLLPDLITADTLIATCHPNRRLEELGLIAGRNDTAFPVGPIDVARQREEIDRVVRRAVESGASIVVLPELSVTEDLALGLHDWVRRPDGPRLLVAGSFHHQDSTGRRRNTALAWVRGIDRPLLQDKHSPADRPVEEDIQPQGWPELRIYVTDGWHLLIAVCRDLLNPQAVHALTESGVNLILVPALSETLLTFGGPVAQLVGACQALVAVANNPGDWSGPGQPAMPVTRALFGHPGFPRQTRPVRAPDAAPGTALLAVRSGEVAWLPLPTGGPDPSRRAGPSTDTGPVPPWVDRLEDGAMPDRQIGSGLPAGVTLRPAAVLVLLSEGPDGPQVLLTERGHDLTDYPGRLVFPGGAIDAGDGSVAAAALREAREEVGLDGDTVRVVGLLPSFALPDSGFLVTPVVAWSRQPCFTHTANEVEVATAGWVPLWGFPAGLAGEAAAGERPEFDPCLMGTMTASLVTQLRGLLVPAPGVGVRAPALLRDGI